MKITITGSLGNISRNLIEKLATKGHQLTLVSSNQERVKAIEGFNATAAIGSVEDVSFLSKAFEGANAVYTMIPPNFVTSDLRGYMKTVGENYAQAMKQTGVEHVVNLSSIGAHIPDGPGPTGANYYVEKTFDDLKDIHVLHLRPGMFYTNFYGSIEMIKHQNIIGNNFNDAVNIAMTHPQDIAAVAAEALDTLSFSGKSFSYVVSDEKTGREMAAILGQAIGKPDLSWIEFSDEALFHGLVQSGLSEQMASIYIIEIGVALRNGTLLEDYRKHQSEALGKTSFDEFSKEFAIVFKNSN